MIDDEEFCLLYDANRSRNPEFPYEEYGKFDLEDIDDTECKAEFHHFIDILVLEEVPGLPKTSPAAKDPRLMSALRGYALC